MKCRTADILLQDYIDGNLTGADTGLITMHLQECAACREDYRHSLDMIKLLKDIPVTPVSAGFAERALCNATSSRPATAGRRIYFLSGGVAASLAALLLAIFVITDPEPGPAGPPILLTGDQFNTIRLAIESPQAIDDIVLTIDVSGNLEIQGYDNQRVISWITRLEKGVNLISLPVMAIAAGDGEIVARVGLGDSNKEIRIHTRHRADANAGGKYPYLAGLATAQQQDSL